MGVERTSNLLVVFQPIPFIYQLPKKNRWIIPRKSHHVIIHQEYNSVDVMPSFILWKNDKKRFRNNKRIQFKDDFDAILKAYAGCIYSLTKRHALHVCLGNECRLDEKKLYHELIVLIQVMNE